MKVKLIQLRSSVPSLNKLYMSEIPRSLAHKISIFTKSLFNHLKTIDETQDSLVKKYEIKDLAKESREGTENFKKLDNEFKDYLFNTEVEIPDIGLTWEDLKPYEHSIIMSAHDNDVLSLFIK